MKVIVGIYKYEEVEVEVDDKFTPIEERKRYIKSTRFPDFTKIAALSEKTYAEFVKAVEDKTGCPVISKGNSKKPGGTISMIYTLDRLLLYH